MTDRNSGGTGQGLILGSFAVAAAAFFSGMFSILGKGYKEYEFKGKLEEDNVSFITENPVNREFCFTKGYILRVERLDGKIIEYEDYRGGDLKIERLRISDKKVQHVYYLSNVLDQPVMKEAQRQFDSYLQKIREFKIREGLESLTNKNLEKCIINKTFD